MVSIRAHQFGLDEGSKLMCDQFVGAEIQSVGAELANADLL
jgi:hypothetical protein